MGRRNRASIVAALVAVIAAGATAPPAATLAADPAPIYYLPAVAGSALLVAQGNSEGAFRSADEAYAFDFQAAEGPQRFPVVAARGGTVISTRSGLRGNRCTEAAAANAPRPDCWRDVNYVLIDHGDGTSGLYLHLRPGQLPVRSGDVVSRGQLIGSAGNTGWTDSIGLQFQVQSTPPWFERGRGGWFMTESQPVAFADPDVLATQAGGVPQSGDIVVSGNPGPLRPPFRLVQRPTGLPATVPFEIDAEREIRSAYEADSPDGYGIAFAPLVEQPGAAPQAAPDVPANGVLDTPVNGAADSSAVASPQASPGVTDPGTIVRPLFGGELAYAGCASGASASLGRMVVIGMTLDGTAYLAVLGHLSEIEPTLLDGDTLAPLIIGPNEFLGRYGTVLANGATPALACVDAEPAGIDASPSGSADLFAAILRDAAVTAQGEIVGGTPVSLEPLVGGLAYEGFDWWSGPLTATAITEEPGRPRARWNRRTPANASHVVFGDAIRIVTRVRDATDIREVRFRAFYPGWPRIPASSGLDSFSPTRTWRLLGSCVPARRGGSAGTDCRWNGSATDAIVSFTWDPSVAAAAPGAPWLPRATVAMTRASTECLPVSLAVEVVNGAGHVFTQVSRLPTPSACDERGIARDPIARVIYLDPLVPPEAPAARGEVSDRGWPPVYEDDPLDGAIVWRDRSDNEDGFRIYARRSWFEADCSVTDGPWKRIAEVEADTVRYRPNHRGVVRSIPVPEIPDVPGSMTRWEYAVSAFNEAGETRKVAVGGFLGGSEAFCDPGLVPPPGL